MDEPIIVPDPPPYPVAHSDHGNPECCGLILPEPRGDQADITCNECGAVIGILPAAEAESTLLRMAIEEGVTSEKCPHCGEVNVFTGFSSVFLFNCRHCGEGVDVEKRYQ